jgi:hypothetical protein
MQYLASVSAAALCVLGVACEGEPGPRAAQSDAAIQCVDPASREPATGAFATPDLLASEVCQSGTFAEFDPNGRWYLEQDNHGLFNGIGPVDLDLSCQSGLQVAMGTIISQIEIEDSSIDEDYLFWRRERVFDDFDLTIVDAYLLCGVDAEGRYVGQAVRCRINESDGEQCDVTGLTMVPFGRIPGEDEAQGLELVSEYSGEAWSWRGDFSANVRVHEDIAYVVIDEGGMRVVDISNLETPVEIGVFEAQEEEGFNDVKIVTDAQGDIFALLASNSRGMVVVDVTNPNSPQEVVALTPSGEPNEGIHTLFTEVIDTSTIAYLADGSSNVVTIWDVSNPRIPVKIGAHESADPDWGVHDVFADQGRLYVNATVGGLIVADTQPNPSAPVHVGQYTNPEPAYSHVNWVTEVGGRKITVHGDEGFDAHFKIIDVDPASADFMKEIGRYQTRSQVSAHNVIAVGNKAYAAYYQDGVRVLDLSDPTNPTLAAYFNTWSSDSSPGGMFEGAVGIDVDAEKGLIYVADYPRGLLILREQ